MADFSLNDDIIDVRDIIARIEELRSDRDSHVLGAPDGTETPFPEGWVEDFPDHADELDRLESLMTDLEGMGGDEQWEGVWYPITLIRDSYFQDYAQELAEDIGAINADARWPNNCIDWEKAARELQMDYSGVDIAGVTYWTR